MRSFLHKQSIEMKLFEEVMIIEWREVYANIDIHDIYAKKNKNNNDSIQINTNQIFFHFADYDFRG